MQITDRVTLHFCYLCTNSFSNFQIAHYFTHGILPEKACQQSSEGEKTGTAWDVMVLWGGKKTNRTEKKEKANIFSYSYCK